MYEEIIKRNKYNKYKCPCCGNYTIEQWYDICPVCFWEDDGTEEGTTSINIYEARKNYKKIGACEEYVRKFVRKPYGVELPGFYEDDNYEATNDPTFLKYKEYLKDPANTYSERTYEKLYALAYSESEYGFKAAIDLAMHKARGGKCNNDTIVNCSCLADEILDWYKISSKEKEDDEIQPLPDDVQLTIIDSFDEDDEDLD